MRITVMSQTQFQHKTKSKPSQPKAKQDHKLSNLKLVI
jgi:hypothetical protein